MGVYIPGMKMPKNCASCDIACAPYLEHGLDGLLAKICHAESRLPDCPLIPVPPHGRLGDLDAAAELAMQYCPDDDGACSKAGADLRELLDEIENLPTIITAEPAEEGQ